MKKIKIIIVDDDLYMRVRCKNMLLSHNFFVLEASNGIEAITKYQQKHPDLVFMDITMPEMNGIEAMREIINLDSKAKIVMLSAAGQEALVMKALQAGALDFILKPFEEDHLIRTAKRLTEEKN